MSKRTILSEVVRLFDSLGLLDPLMVTAKLVLQELWQSGCQSGRIRLAAYSHALVEFQIRVS